MRRRLVLVSSAALAALLVLIACLMLIESSRTDKMVSTEPLLAVRDIAEASPPPLAPSALNAVATPPDAVPEAAQSARAAPLQVSVPKLAYAFVLSYRVPGRAIAEAQQAHVALCQRLGVARCQLVSLERSSTDEGYGNASLRLRVASDIAQAFSRDLTKAVAAAGGRAADTSITGDDVSKELVDTEARIRQREILVGRLTEMLRNRQGRVSELVEAERTVAQAQEELDQAKGWLQQLRGRVSFSQFTINYMPATVTAEPSPRGFSGRLGDAVVQSGAVLFGFMRGLLIVTIFLLPWAMLAVPGLLLLRRWHRHARPRLAEA